jgi:hypothetical protein
MSEQTQHILTMFSGKRQVGRMIHQDRQLLDRRATLWNASGEDHTSMIECRVVLTNERVEDIAKEDYLTQARM